MPSTDPIPTQVHDLQPGDRIDLIEAGQAISDMRWIPDPWHGRDEDFKRAETHYAEVERVVVVGHGTIVRFTEFTSWYMPTDLTVNTFAPK